MIIQCHEPQGRPSEMTLRVEAGESFCVYVLADAIDGESELRATVLRRADALPPAGALLLLELSTTVGASGLRVARAGTEATVDLLRTDLRSRLGVGMSVRAGSRLEAVLPNQRRISFLIQTDSGAVAETSATVGAGGTRSSAALAASRGAMWLLPTAWALLTDMSDVIIRSVVNFGRRLGISTRTMVYATTLWFFTIGAAVAFYTQSQAMDAAVADVASGQEALARESSARELALSGEMSCLAERGVMAAALADVAASLAVRADAALGLTAARGVAVTIGGTRMAADDLRPFDDLQAKSLTDEVARLSLQLDPVGGRAEGCLAHSPVLGTDLPRYALLWHPSEDLVCPADYRAVQDGATLAGRWGISDRVAATHGAADAPLEGALDDTLGERADLRVNDRWSAAALASALRTIQDSLLRYDGGGRPPVAPSESQVWALAFFAAYNSMPAQADGTLDVWTGVCVSQVLDDALANSPPASPGEPILPDLVRVANQELVVAARPTPGCPWQADALARGAQSALRAAARLITVTDDQNAASNAGGDGAVLRSAQERL